MATWQTPISTFEKLVAAFVVATEIYALCARKLKRQGRVVIEQALQKRSWGQNTGNTSAIASGESNRA
eukprot:4886231-Alexandrium_andersonii.AAC.1